MKFRAPGPGIPAAVCLLAVAAPSAGDGGSFRTDILPLLTKAGCNTGACHGAASGQGGFRLSLFGYDPEADHERITRERGGRRVDFTVPAESLVLRKPSRQIDHEGGRRLPHHSGAYEKIRQWIARGAPFGSRDLSVTAINVEPGETFFPVPNQSLKLRVTALLSNGSSQEVTQLALYSSNDDAIAAVSPDGEVRMSGRGVTSIMVRYSGQVAAARVAVPIGDEAVSDDAPPPAGCIDEQIAAELKQLRLPQSPLSRDGEFLRRVHLDLAGRLPSPEEARAFLSQPGSPAARLRVIDELLAGTEFVDYWTMRFADLLLISGKRGSEAATRAWHQWVRDQIARNTPFDKFAEALLTSSGSLTAAAPANFFMLATDPRDLAEHAGRIFLGTQVACARCHAHPSDRWTQVDYHRFAAYFARVTRDGGTISVSTRGEVEHPKTGEPLSPKPLGGAAVSDGREGDRRIELAEWMTRADNPFFARTIVNRVWKHLMGRGLVEPVDDLRPTNPPTHPALLDTLARDFTANGCDLRRLIRTIVSSRTWQLTSRSRGVNHSDDRFYSHAFLKALPAAVFMDAVAQVTGVPDEFDGYPNGTRAVQLVGARTPSYALDVLGRCSREASCDGTGRAGGGLGQALHLINGPTLNDKLRDGIVAQLLDRETSDRNIIEELFLRSLTRFPSPEELAEWEPFLTKSTNRTEAVQDLLWMLLNSREFAFNH